MTPEVLLAGGLTFVAIALGIYGAATLGAERNRVRAVLRSIEGYEAETLRQKELEAPLAERLLQPFRQAFSAVGRRLVPTGYLDRIRHKLVLAGRGTSDELDRFRAIRVASLAMAPVGLVLGYLLVPPPTEQRVAAALFLALLAVLGPDAILNREVQERQNEVRRRLPDLLDLLTISVEAGLGFEQALDRTVIAVPGPLSTEFARMLGEIRAGAGRADALRALADRVGVPEVRSFVLALIQAETFGVSIARVLRNQADEMRVKRRQFAQERAQKAQVKMLIPMVLCIFPAFFVVVLGPAIIQVSEGL
ncbi:MAG: type II secretion system F family protein [Acidimicrobiia bacterium]